MARWTKVGSILKSKDGQKVYMKISNNVSLVKDQTLVLQDPRKRPNITAEDLAKIPDFVRFEVFLPPPKEE